MHIATTMDQYINEQYNTKKLNDNFWSWFGNSRMVDDTGNPIIFYHGSGVDKKYNTFNSDKPVWFTKSEQYANAFGSNIYKVFLKIENHLYIGDIDGVADVRTIAHLSELSKINIDILEDILNQSNSVNLFNITNSNRFKKLVEEMGYDGLEAKEGHGITTFAVFNSNQIKSINNKGDWSIGNDNINY